VLVWDAAAIARARPVCDNVWGAPVYGAATGRCIRLGVRRNGHRYRRVRRTSLDHCPRPPPSGAAKGRQPPAPAGPDPPEQGIICPAGARALSSMVWGTRLRQGHAGWGAGRIKDDDPARGYITVWPRAGSEGLRGLNSRFSIRVRGQSGPGLGGRSLTESKGLVWAGESFLGETAHLQDRL
jgi:hypothetical protein